jgi:hypothetical protein
MREPWVNKHLGRTLAMSRVRKPQHNMGADLITHSRVTYGTKDEDIKEEIREWYSLNEDDVGHIDLR